MKYKNEDWLRYQREEQNRSFSDIAIECNVNRKTIEYYAKKFEIRCGKINNNIEVDILCSECRCETSKPLYYLKRRIRRGFFNFYCSKDCADKRHSINISGASNPNYEGTWNGPQFTKEQLSAHGVKGFLSASSTRRTSIEVKMAEELRRREINYIEQHNLANKFALDFFLPEFNIVIECDGDYWHRLPKNIARDKSKNAYIKACGLSLYRFWESEINADVEACVDVVLAEINEKEAI